MALVGVILLAGGSVVVASSSAAGADVSAAMTWSVDLPDVDAPTAGSSPILAHVNGHQAVVFGDRAGNVYAFDNNTGAALWTAHSYWPGASVDSPISQSGNLLYFGVGTWANPAGGFQAVNASTGATVWHRAIPLVPNGTPGYGDIAGLTVGNLAGTNAAFAGSLGQMADALDASTGSLLNNQYPWFQGDTNSSTAVLAPIGPNGANEIVYGGAQTANSFFGFPNGGHVRVINSSAQVQCNYFTQQPVYSSPALGRFLAGGGLGITASTQFLYEGQGQINDILGFDTNCRLAWDRPVPGIGTGSPIVVDALGNHGLQIADTSWDGQGGGQLTLVNGVNGAIIWQVYTGGPAMGGPASVDLGGGYQDLVVATTAGLQIFDGRSGQNLFTQYEVGGFQNTPLVSRDSNGTVGITLAGYFATTSGHLQGRVVHFEVSGSNGALVTEARGWPEFHHDSQLTGDAGTAALPFEVACTKPARPSGYILATGGGEVYNYGNIPYCGSAVSIPLGLGHIVGAALTPDGGGYYLVGDNGGVFAFGDARFYGAASSYHPRAKVVGMAVTARGGYYEVTSAGGLYSFGPGATFYGSGASYPGGSPVVGMAIHPGGGYWEARSGGGLLSFHAPYEGAATGTATPVVGMAAATDGSGYWEFTAAGGVFTYGAPQEGASTGTPVAGAAASRTAQGFWQVGPTGAIFAHGPAYLGGRNRYGIEYPVTAISGI